MGRSSKDPDMMSDSQVLGIIVMFCVSVGLIFICFVLLLYFGIAYAYPYYITRDFENQDVVCQVDVSYIDKSLIPCQTIGGKRSSYHCVDIRATFTKRDGEEVNYVQVYKDFRGIERRDRCFHHPWCHEDTNKADEETNAIFRSYFKGKKFLCYYNYMTDQEVVVDKVRNTTVLHMMFWPSFGVLAGTITTIVVVIPMGGGQIIGTCCHNLFKKKRNKNRKYVKRTEKPMELRPTMTERTSTPQDDYL